MEISANYAFLQSQIEVFAHSQLLAVNSTISMFDVCSQLKKVDFILLSLSSAAECVNMFNGCSKLETCYLKSVSVNISIGSSPLITIESLQYLIQYRANGTTPITITVHPTVFAKLTDNTNYPTWYAVNQDALTKYITFASA